MKKILSFVAATTMAVALASCGGKTAQNTEDADSLKTFEQSQIEADIKAQLDSMATVLSENWGTSYIKDISDIKLTEEEAKVKPDYLLDPALADEMVSANDKEALMAMLALDIQVAKLYGMDIEKYKKAMGKLAAELNDPAFKMVQESDGKDYGKTFQKMYKAMEESGRINFFWTSTCAVTVEMLYIMSQNSDKFLSNYTDEQVAALTFRLAIILDDIELLSTYDPEIPGFAEACEPLKAINATSVAELKSQLVEVKEQIAAAREALLK